MTAGARDAGDVSRISGPARGRATTGRPGAPGPAGWARWAK